jgi:multiple sugar transport system substrate-binding protein
MLEPLDDRIKAWQRVGDFLPIALQISKQRTSDPTCIMLHDMHINYLYYRADWLKEAGLKPPDTLDDMLEVAKAFTKPPNRYGYGFRGGDGWGFNLQLLHYLKANGVDVVKEDGSTDIDSPPAVETVDWYASLATKHKVVQPSAATDKYPQLYAALQGGKIGLFQHGLWSWKIQNDVLGEKISAVQVPKGKARRWISVYGEGTVVYRTSKLKDEAWLLASFLAEPEQQAIFGKERGGPPLFKSTQDDRFYKESRFFQAAMMSKESWGQQPSWHRRWPEMEDRFAPEMQRILSGESKSAEFCRIMAEIFRKK